MTRSRCSPIFRSEVVLPVAQWASPAGPALASPRSTAGTGSGHGELSGLRPPPLLGRCTGRGDSRTPSSAAAPVLLASFLRGEAPTRAGPDRWGCHGSSSIPDRHFLRCRLRASRLVVARTARSSRRVRSLGAHLNPRSAETEASTKARIPREGAWCLKGLCSLSVPERAELRRC